MPSRLCLAAIAAVAAAPAHAQFLEPAAVIHNIQGESGGDNFGFINRTLGDVDGDGVNDLGVGVPSRDEGGTDAGKVYVYSGATGALIRSHLGSAPGVALGYEMGGVGDLNDDGRAEYVVGAPGAANVFAGPFVGNGQAVLFDGATGTVLHTWTGEAPGDIFGNLVAGGGNVLNATAGDIDGDGVNDVIVCASQFGNAVGRAYVYSGADFSNIHTISGPGANAFYGLGAGGIGDITGDGRSEFVVGAPGAGPTGGGLAYVYDGATGTELPYSPLVPDATASGFGNLFASGPGDIDGDGTLDIFVTDLGDAENGTSAGKAYVFSGANGSRIHVWAGSQANEGFGVGRGCGDADFDGTPDFIIAAFSSNAQVNQGGRAFLLSGATGETLRTLTRHTANQLFGWSTVGCEDVDGDGALDFMFSAILNGNGANAARGRVYVVAGDIFPCFADCDRSGVLNVDDIDCFVVAFLGGALPIADCDGSGVLNVDDIDCFVTSFLEGCP